MLKAWFISFGEFADNSGRTLDSIITLSSALEAEIPQKPAASIHGE
jgi:hypothetical protein